MDPLCEKYQKGQDNSSHILTTEVQLLPHPILQSVRFISAGVTTVLLSMLLC